MSATAPLSPHHSPHSPMLSLSPLGVHAKLPTPPHATQALEVLSSSFNFPEPPSRIFRDGLASARSSPRASRAGSPPPPTMRKKRSPRNSAKRLTQESAKARPPVPDLPSPAQNDFPASAISAPTSPANSSALPSSQPLGVRGNRPSHSSAPPEQSRAAPSTQHPHAHLQAAGSSNVSSARLEHALLGNVGYASDAGVVAQEAGGLGLHMAEAVEADEGDVEQRLSFVSGSGQRHSAVPASQRVSSGSSIYSDQQEYLAQAGDETGDGSAGGLSLSSDSDSYMPVTPATPGHSFSSSFSTSSTWRPRELTLARADAQTERERSLAGLALNPRSASPMMSPWSSSSTIGVPRDRLSPAPGTSSPSHMRGVAGSSSANTSLSSGGGHNSGAAGTRGLMLASAAAPPNSARNFPPLALALPASTGATSTDAAPPRSSPLAPRSRFVSAPGAPLTSQAPLRSPLPVLSRGPAFPPARDATLESMAAERVPNEDLGALQAMLPHRRLLSGSSARLLSPALHSASTQGVISPIASKPSWEKPFGEARSASSDSQYGNEARPMDPEVFVAAMQAASAAEVAAALEARKQLRSTASTSQLAEEVKSAPSARPQMPTRSRSQSFLRSSSMTRRRAPPPPPLLLATAPSNPDMAGAISKDTSAPTTKDSTLDAASSSVVPDNTLEATQESPEFVTAPGISSSPSFEMITHRAGDQDRGESQNLLAPLSLPLAGSASPMSAVFHTPLASPANLPSPESESRSLDDSLMMAVVEAQIDTAIVDPPAEAGNDIAMPETSRAEEEEEHVTADAPDEALEVLVDSPLQTPSNELTANPRIESRENARAFGASSSLSVRPGSLEQPNTAYFDFDSDGSDASEGIREPMIFRKMKTRSMVQETAPEPKPEQTQRLSVADVRSSLTSGSEAADAAEPALGGKALSEAEAESARESSAALSLSAKSDEAAGAAPFEFDDADAESGGHESVAVMRRSSSWGNLEPFEERRVSSPNSSVQGRTSIPPTISFRTSIFKHLDPKRASGPKSASEARADISPFDTDGGDEDPLEKASSRPSAAVSTEDVLVDMLSRTQEVRTSQRVELSKLARSSSQVAPAGPPPSEPLPAPPPGSSLRRSSRSVGRMSRAERTSLAATSQPQAEPSKMPQTAPSRPKRPSGVELEQLDLQPSPMPNSVPSTEPVPQGRWKADAHRPSASGESPERPVHGAEGRSQPLRSRSRPNLTVRTNSAAAEQAESLQPRPRPPVPRSKASLVPEVPSFGYMGPSTPLDSAMISPTSGAGPFSAFSSSSFSDRSTFEPTSSRWSSGSDSEGEASKLAARKAAAKSKKAAKGPQLTSRTSSSSLGQGSMGPPPTPVKKSSFFSGLGLRKKSLTNAAAGAAGVSPASSVGAPSPRVVDAASEFPFPASTGPSPSVAASADGARASTSLHSRNRGGSTSSRASNTTSIGQSLTNRPSLASLRSITSYDPSRRPSVSAESFASPAISGPPSPALEGMPRGFDSVNRRPSNTGLGIDMNGSSSNGPSEPSVRASQGLRSARASLNSLRASRDLAVIRASGESDEDLAASAMSPKSTRRRSQTIATGDGRISNRASRQTPLSSIESPSKTAEGGNKVRTIDAATDDLDDTPRVAYASLPGSRRESVTSPSVARASAKRYFETDHEALDALGSRLYQEGAGDAESQTGTAPNSPTVPSRVSSIRRHERSGSKGRQSPSPSLLRHSPSGSLMRHSPSPSLTRSISASLLRAMSPEVQPSPPPRTTSKPKRLIEKYNGTALPHYPSLTDLGRAWVAQHPDEPLQAASGPRMMARILDGVSKRRQHAGSGSKTPSDASTDDYGSSDGGGAGDHTNSIRSNGHGSAPQRGGDQAGGGGGDDPDGRRNQQSRADSRVGNANGSDESEDESDDYGSQSDEDLELGDALGAGHILGSSSQSAGSSRSESSDDVPLGDRVGNAAALQKRLQDQERKAQIQDARNALERGGVKAASSGKARRPRRVAPVPERAPDAGPLNALDLIGRLQRVQMQRGGDQAPAANDQKLAASQSMPFNAARRPEAREDPHGLQAHLLANQSLPGPSQAQRRPSPRQQTMPLPGVSAPHLRGGATRNGSSESVGRPAQARPSLGSSESQLRAMMMATSHPAQFDPQRRPSLHPSDQQQQRDFRPPVATMMMMPSSGSSSGNSSPRFPPNDHQLQLSSRMAAVIDQGHNFSAPLPPYARQGTSPRLGGSAPLRPMHSAGAAGQPEAREDAVTQARARARSVSRARPPATAIDTRVAPPMPMPALLGRAVPPSAQEVSPQKQAIAIGGPLSALSRSSNEPRSSSESPSTGLERAITAAVPSTVATAHLVQHRVYINTRQRFGTAQILPNARARDLMLDIVEKEHVPTEEAAGGGGGWVIFDCSPTHSIERPMREYESVAEVVDSRPSPDCYFLLKRTELAPFASVRAVPPSLPLLAGYVYVQDHKKKWTKRWLELREHSLFHAKSEKGKDEVLICTLSTFDVYLVDSAKYKTPKAHTFAVRSQNHISQFEKPELDYCHYFSLSDPLAHRHWYRALYTSRSYMLRQERPQLFSPPPRAAPPSAPSPATITTNEGVKAAAAAAGAAGATTVGVSRNTSITDRSASSAQRRIPARGATTDDRGASHRPEGSISGQSAASASASASVSAAAAAAAAAVAAPAPLIGRDALSTGPFEKGSLLAAAAQNQAQSEQIDLSLHERTRARQVEAARKAELAERTRRARAAGQPLIGVPTSRAT